jgi:hypothetical protein
MKRLAGRQRIRQADPLEGKRLGIDQPRFDIVEPVFHADMPSSR